MPEPPSRRAVLKALGGAAALAGVSTPATAGTENELAIHAPNDQAYAYQFAVSGSLSVSSRAVLAPIDNAHVTADAEDDIDGCRVHGAVRGGWDCYHYTGKLAAFTIPRKDADAYTIYHNGEKVSARLLDSDHPHPSEVVCDSDAREGKDEEGGDATTRTDGTKHSGFCPLDNEVAITRSGTKWDGPASYTIEVTGDIEMRSGKRVGRVEGRIKHGHDPQRHVFAYSGEITHLSVSNLATVRIGQREVCE